MTLYARLSLAIEQGINEKLLLLATGLDSKTFWRTLEEQDFTNAQRAELELVLKEWKS